MTDLLPDLESQLERYGALLRDELAAPPVAVPIERRTRPRSRLVLTAAAVVFAVLVGAAVVVSRSDRHPGRTPATNPASPSTTVRPGQDPHRLAAETRAADLVDRVRPGPGWTPAAAAPVAVLAQPASRPLTPDLVQRTRWWTAPGPWDAVDTWIQAHPPADMTGGGQGSSGDHGVTTERDFVFITGDQSSASVFRQQWLMIETAPLPGGRVGIRADAQVVWVPTRPADEVVPAGEAAVTITATWGFGPGVDHQTRTFHDRRTIDALAHTLNGLAVADPGPHSCALDQGLTLTLRFVGPSSRDSIVSTSDPACYSTTFVRSGVAGPGLAATQAYLDQLARALGTTMTSLYDRAEAAATIPPRTTTTR